MLKLIVWDLDNTIWQGTWLEDRKNVTINLKIIDLLKYVDSKGILQSISSKNDHTKELETFLNILDIRKYFINMRINWQPKSQNIFNIKETLSISKWEDILFIDDEKFELEEVKFQFPNIQILEAKNYSSLFLNKELLNKKITEADKNRKQVYLDNIQREDLKKAYTGDYLAFLKTLNMEAIIRKATEKDVDRIHQLLVRTNQWNSAIYTMTTIEIKQQLDTIKVMTLKDKIGDYGLIGIKIEKYNMLKDEITIDNMTISCRTAGRGLGTTFVIGTINKQLSNKKIIVKFKETKYNTKLHELYNFLNFKLIQQENKLYTYEYIKKENLQYPDWLKVNDNYLDIKLKKATETDYETLCNMAKESKFTKDFVGLSYRWGWKDKITIALNHDKIIGFQYYNICKHKPWANSYYIYIIPEMRGKGIGSILFNNFIIESKKAGKTIIKWLVSKKNLNTYNFYKNNGLLPKSENEKDYIYEINLEKNTLLNFV